MFSLLHTEFFKLRKRAMGWVMLAIIGFFVLVIMVADAALFPGKTNYNFSRSILAGAALLPSLGTFTIIILGAIVVGSEYGYDTWKNLLIRHSGRVPFILSKWLTMLISLGLALVSLMILGVIIGQILQIAMHLTGLPVNPALSTLFISILTQMLMPIIAGSMAILGAVVWRSSVAGIVFGLFWFILDAALGGFAPMASVGSAITAIQLQLTGQLLSPGGILAPGQLPYSTAGLLAVLPPLIVIVYLVVPITLAAICFKRRDMLGVS